MQNTSNLTPGTLLKNGEYRIEQFLGQGGFGITYAAVQVSLGRKVAIKEFFMKGVCERNAGTSQVSVSNADNDKLVSRYRDKFLKEARNIASLEHPNIVPIIDVFECNGTAYYVMKHFSGASLAGKVLHGALPEEDAVRYTRQVADALAFVHSKRMMHLDVKPANILLDDNDNAVLIDFGLAKQYDTEGHQTSSTPVGISHGYAPLEQYKRGGVSTFSPATDIYSLGATLFKLVTGITPPEASDVNDEGLPVLPSDISASVRRAIEAAMQPKRKDRPQSVEEFLELLKGSKDLKDPKAFKDLSEETVMPSGAQKAKAIKEQSEAVEAENEETRALEKEPEQVAVTNNEPSEPKKNRTVWVFAVALLVILITVFFNSYNSHLEDVERERIALIEQQRQDSIDAVNAAREREEQNRLAEQQAREEAARREREEQARREREEAERLAREQQQGISTQKKVDLGLSVCWAGWNVGASSPEEYGNYYAWGKTTTISDYSESNNRYRAENIGNNISGTRYDVARAQWGSSWRMPTTAEFQELINRCTRTWTSYKGIDGYKVTGPNGNSIFLPAAGRRYGTELDDRGSLGAYWSGSLDESNQSEAYCLGFGGGGRFSAGLSREYGFTVRPVCDK